jgi:hypothetical protein
VRAIEVTDNSVGDAPMLPELLGQIPADEVSGHGARGGYGITASGVGVIPFRISFMQQSPIID